MNINKAIALFLRPRGNVSRYIDSVFIVLAGFASILSYYIIEYSLCAADKCLNLAITEYWYDTSTGYVIYGVCLLILGVFVHREKNLPLIYALAIVLAVAVGTVYSCMIIFGMSKEIASFAL